MIDSKLDGSPPEDVRGLRHRHGSETASTIGELRRAQRSLHWDTSNSRILSVKFCDVCGEYDRQSIAECVRADCLEHRICETRFR